MRKTLGAHISGLEERIENLRLDFGMTHINKVERDQIFARIQIAESALDHYRKAYKLERKLMKLSSPI